MAVKESRRAISLIAVLVTLVIVILATISVASTLVAVRATEDRKRSEEDLDRANAVIDKAAVTAATREELQGFKMTKTRTEFLEPLAKYYEEFLEAHKNDPVPSAEVAAAHFRLAGLYAKLGSMKSVPTLNEGHNYLAKMQEAGIDPETYPSPSEYAMGVAEPREWMLLRGASMQEMRDHGGKLFFALTQSIITFNHIVDEYPDALVPRYELATALGYSAAMQDALGRKREAATAWRRARTVLESLVRDQPTAEKFKRRLGEANIALGESQQESDNHDDAIASYTKAVEIFTDLTAADPKNESDASSLESARKSLEELQSAAPAAEVAASPESPDDAAPAGDEPADQQPDASVASTPDEDPQSADGPPAGTDAPETPGDSRDDADAATDAPADDEAATEEPAQEEPAEEEPADAPSNG